jgi:hypothetical protein
MRQIKLLVQRGWMFSMYMGSEGFYYVSASHNTWGDAEGASDNLNEAIKQMFVQAKELESVWG